jgi:hypothetical protein
MNLSYMSYLILKIEDFGRFLSLTDEFGVFILYLADSYRFLLSYVDL